MTEITVLPIVLAVYLLFLPLLGNNPNKWLKKLVADLVRRYDESSQKQNRPERLAGTEPLIQFVAQDWNTRVSFVNGFIVSLITLVSVGTPGKQPTIHALSIAFVAISGAYVLYWILRHDISGLSSTRFRFYARITHGNVCNILLVFFYLTILLNTAANA